MSLHPDITATDWLSGFAAAISNGDSIAVAALMLPEGWFRDILAFNWNFRSLEGRNKITSYLSSALSNAQVTNVRLDRSDDLSPRVSHATPGEPAEVQLAFSFEVPHGTCRGYARLLPDADGAFRALGVVVVLFDLHGRGEPPRSHLCGDVGGTQRMDAPEEYAHWAQTTETDPFVLIGKFPTADSPIASHSRRI